MNTANPPCDVCGAPSKVSLLTGGARCHEHCWSSAEAKPQRTVSPHKATMAVLAEIAGERAKQLQKWPPEHDDEQVDDDGQSELALVAGELALWDHLNGNGSASFGWSPSDRWGLAGKHPKKRDRLLVAAALLAAELERIDRAAANGTPATGQEPS